MTVLLFVLPEPFKVLLPAPLIRFAPGNTKSAEAFSSPWIKLS